MSSGVFRGKESSNRIELPQLVQDLLNFGVLGSLWLWGWGGWWMWVGGGWGCPPNMCTCTHMHTCANMHIYTSNMIISIANGSPHWGNPWEFHMMSYAHTCMHVRAGTCVCMYVGGTLSPPHPHPPTPQPPVGGTPRISQNSIALELIEIFQFCFKI